MRLQRSVETPVAPAQAFAFLSDFTTTTEWDPGTVRTELVSGDGGVGTTYLNTSSFMGRQTELTYVVQTYEPDRLFALRGENSTVVANDSMEIAPLGDGSRVTYTADFEFKGLARFVAPLLKPALKKLGDEAEQGLRTALTQLPTG
jgi:carbon monoxide dehydrogenase subunit G